MIVAVKPNLSKETKEFISQKRVKLSDLNDLVESEIITNKDDIFTIKNMNFLLVDVVKL